MGARTKLDRPVKICRAMFSNPADPMKTQTPSRSSARKAKATGKPLSRISTTPPKKKLRTTHHSMLRRLPDDIQTTDSSIKKCHFDRREKSKISQS
jgi:hypothetical protein